MSWGTSTGTSSATHNTFAGTIFFRIHVPLPPPARPAVCAHTLFCLPCGAPFPEVRRAYRRLARIAHPDRAPPERKAELGRWMALLNRAYEALEKGVAT